MKRLTALLLCVVLFIAVVPAASADTYFVNTGDGSPLSLRDPVTNQVLTTIPDGTPLIPDAMLSTDICAYVTFSGTSGLVLWRYLSHTPVRTETNANTNTTTAVTAAPVVAEITPAPQHVIQTQADDGKYTLTLIGAVAQHADRKNNATGAEMTTMDVTEQDNVVITAKIPKGQKIDHWVINGVRYDFLKTVRIIRMTKFDSDFTIEVVYNKGTSETLLSADAIQARRTGQQLLLTLKRSEFCHIKSDTTGAGGWHRDPFDFTNDYTNFATNRVEKGGQVTAKVRAIIPQDKSVRGWKFNQTEIYPNVVIEQFVVRSLNTSMEYEPIFGDKTYHVTCKNCTFSGGGYSGAKDGYVKAGTVVTVTSIWSYPSGWIINYGTIQWSHNVTITRTINADTNFECYMEIN